MVQLRLITHEFIDLASQALLACSEYHKTEDSNSKHDNLNYVGTIGNNNII